MLWKFGTRKRAHHGRLQAQKLAEVNGRVVHEVRAREVTKLRRASHEKIDEVDLGHRRGGIGYAMPRNAVHQSMKKVGILFYVAETDDCEDVIFHFCPLAAGRRR